MIQDDRIESIDAIRGIALFGVLMMNLVTGFRISLFQQFLSPASADRAVELVLYLVLESKAFSLFALLFGVGLAIQLERLSARGRPAYWLARRLAVLLAFGLVHLLLIWNGDILTEYALAGFVVLLLLRRLGNRALLFAALAFLALYVVGPRLYSVPWPDEAALEAHVALANQAYSTGSFAETRRFSMTELPLIAALHLWSLPRTLGLMLAGAFLWRVGFFRRADRFTDETVLAAIGLVVAGAALTVAGMSLAPVVLALGYGAVLLAVARQPLGQRVLSHFAPLGRMAFTNYLMQSVIFAFVFFGYGLGQFGRMSAPAAVVLGLAVYLGQLVLSKWWLRRYRLGPLEWLWRTLMYGAAQPMSLRAERDQAGKVT